MSKKNIFGKNIAPKGSDRIILDKIIKNSVFAFRAIIWHILVIIRYKLRYKIQKNNLSVFKGFRHFYPIPSFEISTFASS